MDTYSILNFAHQRAKRLTRVVTFVTYTVVLVGTGIVVGILVNDGVSKRALAWSVAGVFVVLTLPLTAHDINDHLRHFESPELQKYIIRILFMVPLYSVTCWLSLGDESWYTWMDALRSLYEAFVIWSFLYFLMGYLGPTEEMLVSHLETKPECPHIFPLNHFWRSWSMGHEFLFKCKSGTLQYVVWKILNVFLLLSSTSLGIYHDGEWRVDGVYFYCDMITNLSQMIAIYTLVLFYQATSKDLADINPLAKFLCIKSVVFFSFWQGSFISVLVYFGFIKNTPYFSADVYAKGLQDFLICIEMFCFAVAHHYTFSYRDFQSYRGNSRYSSFSSDLSSSDYVRALLEAANPRDLVHDIRSDMRRLSSRGSFHGSAFEDGDNAARAAGSADPGDRSAAAKAGRSAASLHLSSDSLHDALLAHAESDELDRHLGASHDSESFRWRDTERSPGANADDATSPL